MEGLNSNSFMPVGTIPLANPHVLHPDACNPAMDLVVLLMEGGEEAAPPPPPFRPGVRPPPRSPVNTKVTLWRMSGNKVWEATITGRVLGMAWSRDGIYLSLLVLRFTIWPTTELVGSADKSTIEHLSVYSGEVVKSVPVPPSLFDGTLKPVDWVRTERDPRASWWPMEWVQGAEAWPEAQPGSSLMMIDLLPRVTPVEPPKPAIINPFAPKAKAEVFKPGMNPSLSTFPALLPSQPLVKPDVLLLLPPPQLTSGSRGIRLLTGTFTLTPDMPAIPAPTTLALALRADSLERFLDVIYRGVNACELAFRESEKQTMIWREELEDCGQQQDMTIPDVHADLFRYLMAGRCGPAVNEWLGSRMTMRTLSKWESTLATAYSTIQKVIHQSITPAVERVLLILDELNAWSSNVSELDLLLDTAALRQAIEVARGMGMLVETMRLDAETEFAAADEWCKWVRYEISRAVGGADDGPALPTYDLKLVWSFMKNGFVSSRFRLHFPQLPDAKEDVLPPNVEVQPVPAAVDLAAVMRATLTRLSATITNNIPSPTPFDASVSTSADTPRGGSPEPPASSPGTVGSPTAPGPADTPIARQQDLELWSWANALVAHCREIIVSFRPRDVETLPEVRADKAQMPGVILTTRTIGDEEWIVSMGDSRECLDILVLGEDTFRVAVVTISAPLLQAAWYDDDELAIVFNVGNERYLAMFTFEALCDALSAPMPRGGPVSPFDAFQTAMRHTMGLGRCRSLGTSRGDPAAEPWLLALNAGRGIGFVLTRAGAEVQVLDMANDEDEEDEVEDDVEMEDSEA